MNRSEFLLSYWRYYLVLERDFIKTLEYVELSEENYPAYSISFARQIQSIGAEMDNFFKEFCDFPLEACKKITDYANSIIGPSGIYTDIVNQELAIKEFSDEIKPFSDWDINKPAQSLKWWQAFNNIKHERKNYMRDASLENVLNALGALYILEMKYLSIITTKSDERDIPDHESDLFVLKNWNYRYISMNSITAKKIGQF